MRAIFFALAMAAALGQAQQGRGLVVRGSGGFGAASAYNRMFNPSTVITFQGRVTGVQVGAPQPGLGELVTLLVRVTNGAPAIVEVGPEWFIRNQAKTLRVGDRVRVTGSKLIRDGRGVIYASEIRRGNEVLALRDRLGVPFWAAYRVVAEAPPTTDVAVTPRPPAAEPTVDTTSVRARSMLTGPIVRFQTFTERRGGPPMVTMVVAVEGVEVPVVLGPLWFLERQDLALKPGDLVLVEATKPAGTDVQFAHRVVRGQDQLVLRTASGTPAWIAWSGG